MRAAVTLVMMLVAMLAGRSVAAQEPVVRPGAPLVRDVVTGMPRGERQEIRVLSATLKPGDKTAFHSHRFPVTVYILEGTFTLEMEGRPPVIVNAGQAMVEPPNVKMTGYNRSATDSTRVVIFYVSDPDTPFFDVAR